MMRSPQTHLTDEEFAGFVTEALPAEEQAAIDDHVEHCEQCAAELEDFYENLESFPTEAWQAQREGFTARLRGIFEQSPPSREAAGIGVLQRFLAAFAFPVRREAVPLFDDAAARAPTHVAVEDEFSNAYVIEDSDAVTVTFESNRTEWAGLQVAVRAGERQWSGIFRQIAPLAIQARIVIPRAALPAKDTVELRAALVEGGAESDRATQP